MNNENETPMTPEQVVEQLRALRAQIPDYAQLTTADSSAKQRAANVDGAFVQATINAIGASPAVQNAVGRTPESLRQDADDAGRWTAVEDELRAMLKGVITANLTRRYRLGLTSLQAYSISRQLVRQPEHADLLPHVQEMRRLNRFGRRRRPAAVAKPQTPPPAAHS
jgi:hypothetical protein